MNHNLLDAPCVFCGYCAAFYYQSNTHKPDCPWHAVGGLKEREEQVRAAIRGVIAERDKLKAALEEIRDGRFPQVCAEYELCTHEGCAASYAAFVIADMALKENGEGGNE